MGKSLRGKDCGKGIYQRKDGTYHARFVNRAGQRQEKYFKTLPEAKNWLDRARHADKYGDGFIPTEKTVDQWFDYWINHIVVGLAPNTIRNYRERYMRNIQPVIGHMKLANVKPMHCQKVLSNMSAFYAGSTIRQTYIAMGTMFKAAKMNDLISKHPMDGVRYTKPIREKSDIKYLTREEHQKFLEAAARSHNFNQYALILETGIRTGELIGLTWDNIDFEKRELTITKTLEYRHSTKTWRVGPPKTKTSYRTIPLTDRAYEILKSLWDNRQNRKESPMLSETLTYVDRHTGAVTTLFMRDLVFINYRTGEPAKNSSYDTHLYKLCDEAGIKRFCMHALRHTYATRAMEAGVPVKALQLLLGHSSMTTTTDTYIHVTNELLNESVQRFEDNRVS